MSTTSGHYVVKVFSTARTVAGTLRYGQVIDAALAAGVAHPPLRRPGLLMHPDSGNHLVVMDLVDGVSFLDLQQYPNDDELAMVLEQARRIHRIADSFPAQHDWWAIPNIARLSAEVSPLLTDPWERELVGRAIARWQAVDVDTLPHVLVHGDLTKANVLRARNGGVAILDFAVANYYPRVHELAMVATNLLHGHPATVPERIELLAALYDPGHPLTPREREALPPYVFACAAMELLGATREWVCKENRSSETRYLLDLGSRAIRSAVC